MSTPATRVLTDAQIGAPLGVAGLGADGKIPANQLRRGGISLDTDGRPYFDPNGRGAVETDSDGRPYFSFNT